MFTLVSMASVDADPYGARIGVLVLESLDAIHMSQKQARLVMEMNSDSQFADQLKGIGHLSLPRLLRLPWPFWASFLPKLAGFVVADLCAQKTERVA